jgi:hypothetical protein
MIDYKAIYIRFWGKILTKGKDYYVCEGKLNKTNSIINDKKFEAEGTGVNSLTFWVTHSRNNKYRIFLYLF